MIHVDANKLGRIPTGGGGWAHDRGTDGIASPTATDETPALVVVGVMRLSRPPDDITA
jgi:hypothetical protein